MKEQKSPKMIWKRVSSTIAFYEWKCFRDHVNFAVILLENRRNCFCSPLGLHFSVFIQDRILHVECILSL